MVSRTTASAAALSGATARVESARSRASSTSASRRSSASPPPPPPRSARRRRARSSGLAVRNTFSGASGNTTVPMSRPSTTTPREWPCTASRCCTFTQWRTSGMAAISETRWVTRSERIARATSTPATSGRNTSSTRTRRTGRPSASDTTCCAPHVSPFPFPLSRAFSPAVSPRLSSTASVIARYSAPESRCAHPSRRATSAAVELLPDAAGPSIAMTRRLIDARCDASLQRTEGS